MTRADIRRQVELFLMNCDFDKSDYEFLRSTVTKTFADATANGGTVKRFDAYEIAGVHEHHENGESWVEPVQGRDFEVSFYSLYGHLEGQGVQCIGDFKEKKHAIEIYNLIVGEDADRFPVTIND